MGTSRDGDELAAKLAAAGTSLIVLNSRAIGASAQVYKESALAAARPATGGDLRLSRWGRQAGGLKLGVGYTVNGSGTASAVIAARPQGPWKVVEFGHTEAKFKRRKGGRGRKIPRERPIKPYRTKGKRVWAKGITAGTPGAVLAYNRTQVHGLAKVFR